MIRSIGHENLSYGPIGQWFIKVTFQFLVLNSSWNKTSKSKNLIRTNNIVVVRKFEKQHSWAKKRDIHFKK